MWSRQREHQLHRPQTWQVQETGWKVVWLDVGRTGDEGEAVRRASISSRRPWGPQEWVGFHILWRNASGGFKANPNKCTYFTPAKRSLWSINNVTQFANLSQETVSLTNDLKYNFESVQFSPSVLSDSLWPHGLQHTRPPCPSCDEIIYSLTWSDIMHDLVTEPTLLESSAPTLIKIKKLILRHYNSKLVKMNVSNLLHLAELTYYQSV